jgi:hypothetical protein
LQQRARGAERRPDDDRADRPGQPQLEQDLAERSGLATAAERLWVDNRVYDPVIELDGAAGRLLASGQYGNRSDPTAPAVTYADEHLLDLDLTGIAPETDGTTRTWRHVPAVVSADGEDELGYPPGRPWGFFTITVPA